MALKYIILTALYEKTAATGYDIVKEFDEMWQYIWRATHQQVYRELGKLLDAGSVSCKTVAQSAKPDKKVYRLTSAGRKDLKAWQQSPFEPGRSNDELLIRIAGWKLSGAATLRKTMALQRELHLRRLSHYREVEKDFVSKRGLTPEEEMMLLPLRKGILAEEAWNRWADEVEYALDNIIR